MDIGEYSKLFDHQKARDGNLAFRDHVLQKANCFNPLVMQMVNPNSPGEIIPPEEIIYKYVESKIPAIVSTSHHSFVIVGHTFNPTLFPPFKCLQG